MINPAFNLCSDALPDVNTVVLAIVNEEYRHPNDPPVVRVLQYEGMKRGPIWGLICGPEGHSVRVILGYEMQPDWDCPSCGGYDRECLLDLNSVVAWMPLPEALC